MAENKDEKIVRECQASGEPYIVFRAKDILSVLVIKQYQDLLDIYTGGVTEIDELVVERIHEFIDWQRGNPALVKLPD